ncbi:hypothetical protein ACWDSD_43700 [Streptomyces spiralis]
MTAVGFFQLPPLRSNTLTGRRCATRLIYGDLYLSERRDGRPFDRDDQDILITLAGAAGIAIENVRLLEQVRDSAEHFQRLLLPTLPHLHPLRRRRRPPACPHPRPPRWRLGLAQLAHLATAQTACPCRTSRTPSQTTIPATATTTWPSSPSAHRTPHT